MLFELFTTLGVDSADAPIIRRAMTLSIPAELYLWLTKREFFIKKETQEVIVEDVGQHWKCSYTPMEMDATTIAELGKLSVDGNFNAEDVNAATLLATLLEELKITHYDVS